MSISGYPRVCNCSSLGVVSSPASPSQPPFCARCVYLKFTPGEPPSCAAVARAIYELGGQEIMQKVTGCRNLKRSYKPWDVIRHAAVSGCSPSKEICCCCCKCCNAYLQLQSETQNEAPEKPELGSENGDNISMLSSTTSSWSLPILSSSSSICSITTTATVCRRVANGDHVSAAPQRADQQAVTGCRECARRRKEKKQSCCVIM